MEEVFVTYEQALRLKELGFDRKCHYHYDTTAFKPVICPNYTANDGEGERWIYADDCNLYEDMNHCQYCSAPTLAQAQGWLREFKQIAVFSELEYIFGKYFYTIRELNGKYDDKVIAQEEHDSYDEALSAGITKAMELLSVK